MARRSDAASRWAIIAIVTPPDEGGGIPITVRPRYWNSIGVRHFAR